MMIKKVLEYLTNICYYLFGISNRYGGMFMVKRFSALDIAYWFVWKNRVEKMDNETEYDAYEVYEGLTHLKLQKLLYYAQGISLALNGSCIFSDKIMAWEHGPVIKSVYDKFKKFGREDIELDFDDKVIARVQKIEENSSISNILNLAYDNFSIYTAWQLREMTHVKNGPWERTVRTKGMNKEIEQLLIKEFFEENIVENA